MPYDHQKTRDLLKTAQAYTHTVYGEFLGQLAAQLVDAEAEINAIVKSGADVRSDVDEANRRLTTEARAHRETKERLDAGIASLKNEKEELLTALRLIAADARSAKKTAQTALAAYDAQKLNPAPAVA